MRNFFEKYGAIIPVIWIPSTYSMFSWINAELFYMEIAESTGVPLYVGGGQTRLQYDLHYVSWRLREGFKFIGLLDLVIIYGGSGVLLFVWLRVIRRKGKGPADGR